MTSVLLSLSTLAAGLVQAVTGFGSGIVMMVFLPSILPILSASAVSATISLGFNLVMTWNYRKHIQWRLIWLPTILYLIASTAIVEIATMLDSATLLKIFGVFMILLSIYFLVFANRIHVKASPVTAGVCGLISGVFSTLFGIGGPPMVLYYLTALQGKEEYLGTIQAYFLITGIYTFVLRIIKGIFTVDLIPMTMLGLVCIIVGGEIGKRIVNKISTDLMRKIVYVFLGITGLINLLS